VQTSSWFSDYELAWSSGLVWLWRVAWLGGEIKNLLEERGDLFNLFSISTWKSQHTFSLLTVLEPSQGVSVVLSKMR